MTLYDIISLKGSYEIDFLIKAVETGSGAFSFQQTAILKHSKYDTLNDTSKNFPTNEDRRITCCII